MKLLRMTALNAAMLAGIAAIVSVPATERAEAAWCPELMQQYCVLSRDGVEYVPEIPPAPDDNGWEPAGADDSAAVIHAAVRVLAADLLRLDEALEEAGATAAERAAHPLLAAITSLLLRSPATPLVSPAGSGSHLA